MTTFGDVEVSRVVEWLGPIRAVADLFPDTPAEAWQTPDAAVSFEPDGAMYRGAIQTWVLRSHGRVVLVDTGVGNGHDRPQVRLFDHLQTDFVDRLAAVGVTPDEVDVVVNTHIHYDHVGWNTTSSGGDWQPAFPNATYLVPQRDLDYFDPAAGRMRAPRTDDERLRFDGIRLVWADSIAPVLAAGQVRGWDGEHRIDPSLRLESAPGHTPGSSVLWLESGDGAVFVGDLLHAPVQFVRPGDACAFDLDAAEAIRSRRRVLAEAARTGAAVFPAHLAGSGAATLRPDGEGYAVGSWAGFDPI